MTALDRESIARLREVAPEPGDVILRASGNFDLSSSAVVGSTAVSARSLRPRGVL
jgi:hypothetical protein